MQGQVASQQKKKTKTQVCPRAGLNRGPHDLISTSHALLRLSYKGLLQVFTIPHSHYFPALVLSKLPEYCYPAEESPQSEQLISASSDPLTTSGDKTIQISRHFSGHGLYRKRSMSRCDGARVEVRTSMWHVNKGWGIGALSRCQIACTFWNPNHVFLPTVGVLTRTRIADGTVKTSSYPLVSEDLHGPECTLGTGQPFDR